MEEFYRFVAVLSIGRNGLAPALCRGKAKEDAPPTVDLPQFTLVPPR